MFKGMKTSMARAKQKAMVSLGRVEATQDAEFDQVAAQFREQHNKTKKLSKFVKGYETATAEMAKAQAGIAQMVMDQYEPHCRMYRAATLNEQIAKEFDGLRQQLTQKFDEGFNQPIADYLGQYKQAEERITERNTRQVDMDRYRAEYKQLLEKGQNEPTKVQAAKEKVDVATTAYIELNQELKKDLPLVCQDRFTFFDSLFANLVDAQTWYFGECARLLSQLEPEFAQVDRFEHRGHRWVLTDDALSSAKKTTFDPALGATVVEARPPSAMSATPLAQPLQQQQPQQPLGTQSPYGAPVQQAPPSSYGAPMAQQAPIPQPQAPVPQQAPLGAVRAKALYPFEAQDSTELSFQFNEVITILRQGGEWWEGEVNGRRGLFPANYVQLLQ